MIRNLLAISALVAVSVSGAAWSADVEDAVVADPDHYTVEFENEHVRVIRIHYGPGEKSVMHSHGPAVAVFLSDSDVRFHYPDGTSEAAPHEAGKTQWSDAGVHLPENRSDTPLEVVLVELKK